MSIGWIFFDSIVLIGLAAVFGYALVKMVRDAQREHQRPMDGFELLDLTTAMSTSGAS